jgi:hypothetical protein
MSPNLPVSGRVGEEKRAHRSPLRRSWATQRANPMWEYLRRNICAGAFMWEH